MIGETVSEGLERRAVRMRALARAAVVGLVVLLVVLVALLLAVTVHQVAEHREASEETARIAEEEREQLETAIAGLRRFTRTELADLEQRLRGLRFVIERNAGDSVVIRVTRVATPAPRPSPTCTRLGRSERCRK